MYLQKYYYRIITNELTAYSVKLISKIERNIDDNQKRICLNNILENRLLDRIIELGTSLNTEEYISTFFLSTDINPHQNQYIEKGTIENNIEYYTNSYIMNLLCVCYINIFLEIQNEFSQLIDNDDLLTKKDLFTQYAFISEGLMKCIVQKKDPKKIKTYNLTFGYKERSYEKIKHLLKLLNLYINLIKGDLCSLEDFTHLLTTDNIKDDCANIYLNIETRQFRYIVDKLQPSFQSLTLNNIELSKHIYTKNNALITANNLSANKIDNPKQKEIIDSIFKEMQ